jgi:hypothetical protein
MVDISALSPNPKRADLLAKLEGQNPGGSVKDRAAKYMILEAEEKGCCSPGSIVLESSSGNTGIALAMICKMRGYTFKVVLPENVSIERRQALEVWGAEIIPSPAGEGSNGAMRRAQEMAAEHPDWWFPFQYGNLANPRAHYETTGPEIWKRPARGHPLHRRARHRRHPHGRRHLPQGAEPRHPGLGDRAAGRGDGRRAEEHRRGVHPAGVHRMGRLRAARPQDDRPPPGVHRVDPPPHRGRLVHRHLVGRDRGRRREVRRPDR